MRGNGLSRWAPVGVLCLALGSSAFVLGRQALRLWFFGDDFQFLFHRRWTLEGSEGLLAPHNEHWSTIPIVVFRTLYSLFGLRHYLPYAAMPIAAHVVVCALLYALLRRAHVSAWVAVLSVVVVAFIGGGAGAENTLWDFQVGFLGSCAFGLLALWLATGSSARWSVRAAVVCLLVLSLMCSGMGVLMVLWVVVALLLRNGLADSLIVLAVPALVYLAWYAAYGHGHSGAPPVDLQVAPFAAMNGLAHMWSVATGMEGAGPVVLVAMVAAVAPPRSLTPTAFALAASGIITLVAAYLLFGFTRSGLGVGAAGASRYVYFGVVFSTPALAAGLQVLSNALRERPWARPVAWVACCGTVVALGTAQLAHFADVRRDQIADSRLRIVAAAELADNGATILREEPLPTYDPDITTSVLERSSVRRRLPAIDPGTEAQLNASVNLQVAAERQAFPLAFARPSDLSWRGFEVPRPRSASGSGPADCEARRASGDAWIDVRPGPSAHQIRIYPAGSKTSVRLISGSTRSEVVRWPHEAGEAVYVASAATAATLRVLVPRGETTVCWS